MNEAQTEFEYIDPALKAAGWGTVESSKVRKQFPITQGRILGHGKRTLPLKADYVLEYKNCRIGVIEAKARDKYYTEGVAQAKDYAERLDIRYTYSTNGLEIYEMDTELGEERDVAKFPTPDELWEMTFPAPINAIEEDIRQWKEKLFSIPFVLVGGKWQPRYYQEVAIRKIIEAISERQQRLLLTMATGTGKTGTAFQICWKLFHGKWNLRRDGKRSPRILFLADRNILANQAFNSFNAFEEDALVRIAPDEIRKSGRVPKNGSIFFTIFQTFLSGPDDSPYFGEYPRDFFDLIIVDECHRGGARDESSWREILKYFKPAVQLGLTATPKRDVNVDTYDYFGSPAYTYSLREGINDGFLTPFKVKEYHTTIDEYQFTSDDVVVVGEVDESRTYSESDFNKIIEIKEREAYRVKLFMEDIDQNHKTLVFCATQIHAAAIRDLINQITQSKSPNYCHRVTANDGAQGEQYLKEFQDNERSIPTILTTSQKLSTGVDAPEIRNIVLLRTINSMVEFKQIVGRGTRLADDKDYFTIYDFVEAHKHFKDDAWDGPPQDPEEIAPREKKPCKECGEQKCICEKSALETCEECKNDPCVCDNPPKKMIRVRLADNKVRELDSMVKTSFWSPEGRPISSGEFVKKLFKDMPQFFKSEEELRKMWSLPDTRKKLLEELTEKGYSESQLEDLRKLVHGQGSDLFDVLSYIAYSKDLVPRLARSDRAKIELNNYNAAQQEFLNFVLEQYVEEGVKELDISKLSTLLELKYNTIADAKSALGEISEIKNNFIGFQEHLYRLHAV